MVIITVECTARISFRTNAIFCFLSCEICNFADDTTPYVCNSSLEYVLEKVEQFIEWFEINKMTMNAEKCHLFITGNKFDQVWVTSRDDMIWGNRAVNLLEIRIDNELKFDEYLP